MKIKYMSDLHIDVNESEFIDQLNPDHKDTILVLAGDVCEVDGWKRLVPFLQNICPNYRYVLYVFGNHEFYRGSLTRAKDKLLEKMGEIPNLIIMDRNSIVIDDVKFIGATLWTDMDKSNPMFMMRVGDYMNDYKVIRWGNNLDHYLRRLRPVDTLSQHARDFHWLNGELTYDTRKTVVITHHAPCISLLQTTKFAGDQMNPAYASRLEDFVADSYIDLWIHGHVHVVMDNDFYGTRIVCNPRGYNLIDVHNFNPNAVIDL